MSSAPTPPVPTTEQPTSTLERGESPRMHSLTGLRAVFAIMVLLEHTLSPSIVYKGVAQIPHTEDFFTTGLGGVTFFFVLSGVVLTWTYSTALPNISFYGRRFARIWPTHLVTWALAIFVVLPLVHKPSGSAVHSAEALVLVQSWIPNPGAFFAGNGPSWSLACEAFFYACFPFLVVLLAKASRSQRLAVAALALVVLFGVPEIVYSLGSGLYRLLALWVFPAYRIAEFVLGILLGLALREGWRPRWGVTQATLLTAALYVAATLICGHEFYHLSDRDPANAWGSIVVDWILLPGALALIAAAASADLLGKASAYGSSVMRWLGDRSFSLYLIHPLIVLVIADEIGTSRFKLHGLPVWVATVIACVVGAHLLYTLIEHPFERRIRRYFNRYVGKPGSA